MRVDLKVPYEEHVQAKRAGARWDMEKKVWYWDDKCDLAAVMRWMPERLRAPCRPPPAPAKASRVHRLPKVAQGALPLVSRRPGLSIWTDGSCEPNPGAGGWAFTASDGREASGGDTETTNNIMELTAILMALQSLPDGTEVTIHSDSQYCINGATIWRAAWARRVWHKKTGEPVANRDLWMALDREQRRVSARFEWVRGHSGDPGNERADELAAIGRQRAIDAEAGWTLA